MESMLKKDIRNYDLKELEKVFVEKGEKPFRAKQVYEWLWSRSVKSFEEMTNLSINTRKWLTEEFDFFPVSLSFQQKSGDGTIKQAYALHDNNTVEGVLIPTKSRMTACISSQAGCSLSCAFCATGFLERKKNLDPGEIYDQVVHLNNLAMEEYQIPLSNIVLMGMGEPLLNYANVMKAIEYITSPKGLGMSSKRITLSTAGISKMIKKLGDDQVKFNLALSLHAPNDVKRNEIMAINETNNLAALKESLKYFYSKTGNKVTLEYIIFDGFNDSIEDAKELHLYAKDLPVMINIIEYNPVEGVRFRKAKPEKVDAFAAYLEQKGIIAKVRRSRGKDIDAACGQLANKNQ